MVSQAEALAATLRVFGADFLRFRGAQIRNHLPGGTLVRLQNVGDRLVLVVNGRCDDHTVRLFDEVESAVEGWLAITEHSMAD